MADGGTVAAQAECPWPELAKGWQSPSPSLTVNVLGPFGVTVRGRPVSLPTGRLRTLLAALATSAGRTVPLHRLAEILWDDDPPVDPRRTLQTYAARLRSALGAEFVETAPAGLRLHADDVDAARFVRCLERAAEARDARAESVLLDEALSLWRGDPFEGVRSGWLERTERPRLVEWYLTGVERRIDLRIREGGHASLTAELEELTARYPLRESLWVRLLVVLDLRGRPAEAVSRYESIRRRIAEELGTEPSPELQRVHAGLLAARRGPGLPWCRASEVR
jgi:DNA-binding SARP family transcriptional activator